MLSITFYSGQEELDCILALVELEQHGNVNINSGIEVVATTYNTQTTFSIGSNLGVVNQKYNRLQDP